MSEYKNFTLRNQEDELTEFDSRDIIEFLNLLFDDEDEFVVLSPTDEPIENISFLQAIVLEDMLHTEIGVITEGKVRPTLYECDMTAEEGEKLFLDFANGKWSGDMSKYTLCEFQP